jgi:hypothetical protein
VVIPVRHPLAVAGSLSQRNGFATEKSVLLWAAYMLAAEAYTRDLPRAFTDYDRLLDDWRGEVGRIEAAHGAPLPNLTDQAAEAIDAFLTPELRHNPSIGALAELGWAGALAQGVFDWFEAAAAGQEPDAAALEAIAQELARRREEVGALISPVTRDLDAARAEVHELRQTLDFVRAELDALTAECAEASRRLDSILAGG